MTSTHGQIHVDFGLPQDFRLATERLDLIPAGLDLANTSWRDHAHLSQLLRAEVPPNWPPELVVDPHSVDGTGWWDWYVVKRHEARPVLVGSAGLKGWPAVTHTVQLGCAFLPEYQRQGFGTEAVEALTNWLLSRSQIRRVLAEVPIGNQGSIAVLRKLGFHEAAREHDERLLRFEKGAA